MTAKNPRFRPLPKLFPRVTAAALCLLAPLSPIHAAVPVDDNGFFHLNSGESNYVGYAPDTYTPTKPISLFVWMHGCGGDSEGDLWMIAPYATRATQSYIAISLGGRDGACWHPATDTPKVLAAIRDVSQRFKINPRKIYLGGYSSGGDLAYRTAFENTSLFAGILAENTDPFRDTGRTSAQLLAAASWKINVAHLAHLSDTTYPIAGVRANLDLLVTNGFPVVRFERPGTHYDDDDEAAGTGTNHDFQTYLLPYLDVGWTSPAPAATKPVVTVRGKKSFATTKAACSLAGTTVRAARIEVKVGKAKYKRAHGIANWKFTARLARGRNVLLVRAVSASGTVSKTVKLIITRRTP